MNLIKGLNSNEEISLVKINLPYICEKNIQKFKEIFEK
jgi:hypothetical protein